MNTTKHRRLQELRARWVRWEAQLFSTGTNAPRATRRRLATGFLVCVAAEPAVQLLLPVVPNVVCAAGFIVGMALRGVMSNATRNAAGPLGYARDEMLTRIRDSYRSRAYPPLATCALMGYFVLDFVVTFAPPISHAIVGAVMWPLMLLSFGLPTLLACWSLPDIDQSAK